MSSDKVFDASTLNTLKTTLKQLWNIDSYDIEAICNYHKSNDVFYWEAAEKIKKINSSIDIDKIILHHVTNTFDIDAIRNLGFLPLDRWLELESIKSFLSENHVKIDLDNKRVFYKGEILDFNFNLSNVNHRVTSDRNISASLFKEDFYQSTNLYTGKSGRLIKAPEFIFELDRIIDIDLLQQWKNKGAKMYIVSFIIDTDLVRGDKDTELLDCSLQWLCEGHSNYCNEFQIKGSETISPKNILSIEKLSDSDLYI